MGNWPKLLLSQFLPIQYNTFNGTSLIKILTRINALFHKIVYCNWTDSASLYRVLNLKQNAFGLEIKSLQLTTSIFGFISQ